MSDLLDWLIANEPSFRKSRLPSLYSDLSLQRTTNPDGYAANITAWQSALYRAALAGRLSPSPSAVKSGNDKGTNLVLQTSDDLLQALSSPQYGRPLGLAAVIVESLKAGKMIPVKDFLSAERSIYIRSWVPSPWTVLHWGLKQIGLVGEGSYEAAGGKLRVGNLVLVGALEKVAGNVMAAQEKRSQSLTDRIMSREMFAHEFARADGVALSDQDVEVLLRFLQRDKQVIAFDDQTVKFQNSSSTSDPISSQDTTIASLKTLISHLTTQCDTLSARITALSTNATTAVKTGNRVSALSALRSKKLAEKNLQQRSSTLHQLEEVYAKMEQAVDQVEVVRVMEASAGVLRGLNKQVGGVEGVEDVVEKLREEMVNVDEVGGVLREGVNPNVVIDDGEIDDELEEMEKEQQRKNDEIEAERRRREAQAEADRTRQRLEELDRAAAAAAASHHDVKHREQEEEEQATVKKRLAELEQRAKLWKEKDGQRNLVAESGQDSVIDESTKRLSQVSLEDEGGEGEGEGEQQHTTPRKERVAEAAS